MQQETDYSLNTLQMMKKFFTRQTIAENLKTCWKRFPATICFTVVLTAYLLFLTWTDTKEISERFRFVFGYYLSVGSFLSLTLSLWNEEMTDKRRIRITNAIAHLLLVADSLYLFFMPDERFGLEIGLAHAAILTTLGLSLFLLPFFREKDDIPSWNFTSRLIGYAAITTFIGLLMMGGLSLLTASLTALFGIHVSSDVILSLWILCNQLLSTLLFLGLVPAGKRKHDSTTYTSTFLNKVIRYLLLPLLGCYLVVLYGYAAKILVEMQLPDGWISKLVTALMFGCLCVETGFYPSIKQDGQPFEKRVARWLPVLILPMLVLMSIAVGRRISDYGITVSRLYLLALNIWFYVVCIGLFANRARRIHWIPISFAALFLAVSVLPVNFVSLTREAIRKEINTLITKTYKGKLPFDEKEYKNWLHSLPAEQAERAGSLLAYMDYSLNDTAINDLIKKGKYGFSYMYIQRDTTKTYYSFNCPNRIAIPLPQGYTTMRSFWESADSPYVRKDTLVFNFPVNDSVSRQIHVPVRTLKTMSGEQYMEPFTIYADSGYQVIVTDFTMNHQPDTPNDSKCNNVSFTCSGYVFEKN